MNYQSDRERFGRSLSFCGKDGLAMAKTVTRPKITVQAVYVGEKDMREMFVSLLVNEVRKGNPLSAPLRM